MTARDRDLIARVLREECPENTRLIERFATELHGWNCYRARFVAACQATPMSVIEHRKQLTVWFDSNDGRVRGVKGAWLDGDVDDPVDAVEYVPAERLREAVEALEEIDTAAHAIVLNDEDAQARHQRIADLAHDALAALGGR